MHPCEHALIIEDTTRVLGLGFVDNDRRAKALYRRAKARTLADRDAARADLKQAHALAPRDPKIAEALQHILDEDALPRHNINLAALLREFF